MQTTDEKSCCCQIKKIDKKSCDCCCGQCGISESLEGRIDRLEKELQELNQLLEK
jgi:hypothetical protein